MESTTEKKQWEVSEIHLTYNPKVKPSQRPKITTSRNAYEVLNESWNDLTINLFEQFKVMLINRANRVLGIIEISSGGVTGTVADAKLIFGPALKGAASGIILSHYAK